MEPGRPSDSRCRAPRCAPVSILSLVQPRIGNVSREDELGGRPWYPAGRSMRSALSREARSSLRVPPMNCWEVASPEPYLQVVQRGFGHAGGGGREPVGCFGVDAQVDVVTSNRKTGCHGHVVPEQNVRGADEHQSRW